MASGCLVHVGVILFVPSRERSLHVWGLTLGTYDPLRDYLAGYGAGDEIRLTFCEVEELVGRLPLGAKRLRQWWANGSGPRRRRGELPAGGSCSWTWPRNKYCLRAPRPDGANQLPPTALQRSRVPLSRDNFHNFIFRWWSFCCFSV